MEQIQSQIEFLKSFSGIPKYVDFQILAIRTREAEGNKYQLALKIVDPKSKAFICNAIIYPMEWFPGRNKPPKFSHYHNALRYCYAGLASENRNPELLLQVMKALWLPGKKNDLTGEDTSEGQLVILKFIISPDYNITGAELELAFNCPAKYFYESFLGLQRTIRNAPTSIGFVRGNAIHKGIQYASNEWVRSQDPVKAMKSYNKAILDEWRDNFDVLLRKSYVRGPNKDLKLPLQVDSIIVDQIAIQFEGIHENQLLNESLLFSPERGISGRADQIILKDDQDELWEIKTGSRYFIESDYDPLTGVTHPGGVQAFAYTEIIKKVTGKAPQTYIEFFDADAELADDNPEIIPLQDHAVIKRRKIDLAEDHSDEYLDLLLQTRNIAFAIESGLLSGYDRYKINKFLSRRFMPALGTDFNLLSSNWNRICNYCPSNQQGICADGRRLLDPDIWLHFPQALYEYWSWYFRQLRFELNNVKKHLHKLATTDIEILEHQGITISNLVNVKFDPFRYILTLKSDKKIFTRIREGDDVFVTPANLKPGEIFSMEGSINSIKGNEVVIKTRSSMKGRSTEATTFRIDQVENVIFSQWQSRSLTDFLFESMNRSGILGRKIDDQELPYLIKLILGLEKPRKIHPQSRKGLLTTLDKFKVSAIEKALGLEPGDILLVQGPPGSGKTRMIAQMAKEIFSEHYLLPSKDIDESASQLAKPVLILANTHRAADEVIAKLASFNDLKPFIIRLESYSKDHSDEVKEFIIPIKANFDDDMGDKADADRLVSIIRKGQEIYQQAGIIVGTLGSVGSNLLKGINFHWVIVDEAGQATEPASLGAFRHFCPETESLEQYPRIVFVGDHKQLPPVVAEETVEYTPEVPPVLLKAGLTKEDSLKISLFERLFRIWYEKNDNVVILSEQYRMNEAISRIVKNAFYPQVNYVPATEKIGKHTIDEFLTQFKKETDSNNDLVSQIFHSKHPVVLINTEKDPAAGEGIQDVEIQTESRFNIREAKIIGQLITDFLKQYSSDDQLIICNQIGIISPYRHQNNLIYSELRANGLSDEVVTKIRVDTVDRFQGDERELIILSLTNSNDSNIIGQLHRDWRRMNVSISRAKAKLLIVGNRRTFTAESPETKEFEAKQIFKEVFGTIDELKKENNALEFKSEKIGIN
ncbi:MAG TPA: AAA domain-containing protein [Candidatus Bathyarchaeia archaeon]|nr:AAA domain-containing protein [Candidatus Bathyarchaeia archaeon]